MNIKDLSPQELEEFVTGNGMEPFRARQIGKWVYRKGAVSFDEMTDLSKEAREFLKTTFSVGDSIELAEELISRDGTRKYLFRLRDGNQIESVLIPDKGRHTLCISSQVGCALGCTFCLTGTVGRIRNLPLLKFLTSTSSSTVTAVAPLIISYSWEWESRSTTWKTSSGRSRP